MQIALSAVLLLLTVVQGPPPPGAAPVFQDRYFVMGVLYLPYAEIKEPFQAFYNLKIKKSRVDYYGDLVKTYQRADEGQNGVSYKIAFMPDPATGEPQRTCFQVNGSDTNSVTVQTVLPDLSNFTFTRVETCPNTHELNQRPVLDQDCERWDMTNAYDQKVSKYSFWLQRDTNGQPIPVYYIMKGYNSLLGSHYDKYMVRYDNYDTQPYNEAVFDVDNNVTCRGFPGPGLNVGEHNPIKEFVDNHDAHVNSAFEDFKAKHGKNYDHPKEHIHRKTLFTHNFRYINSKNRAGLSYRLNVNHLTDMSDDEMRILRGRQVTTGYNGGRAFLKQTYNPKVPDTLDWRIMGAVTPVKDQAVCGSCWSFGTTGTIEGAYFVKTGHLVRLSQQQLIDCSWNDLNNGCDGGEDFRAYQYIQKAGGLASEEDYGPYLGQDGRCNDRLTNKTVNLVGYVNVTSGDKEALKLAVANHGPISVGIDASKKSFSFYSSGVYYDPQCGNKTTDLDHAVLAVGYGTLSGQQYWLVKNSWSTYWGNDGYVLMSQKDNNCGVATEPTFVML